MSTIVDIRERAHASARAEIARDVGEMLIGDAQRDAERDWARRYLVYYFNAFAYYSAIALGATAHAAADIVAHVDVQHEIAARVSCDLAEVAA